MNPKAKLPVATQNTRVTTSDFPVVRIPNVFYNLSISHRATLRSRSEITSPFASLRLSITAGRAKLLLSRGLLDGSRLGGSLALPKIPNLILSDSLALVVRLVGIEQL